MKIVLEPKDLLTLSNLLFDLCLRVRNAWLPDNLRAAKPEFCALFEQLRAGETEFHLDRPQVETLREVCRWVANELGPDELDTVASLMMSDVDSLDAALKHFAK